MSAEQTPDIADLAAVLEAHSKTEGFTKRGRRKGIVEWSTRCICGEETPQRDHRAHVAAALAPVLAAAVREAEQRAWEVAAQRRNEARRYYVAWQVARMRARAYRADRITEPVSHEAATSGEEASKA